MYCVRNVFPHPGGPCIQRMGDCPSGDVQFWKAASLAIHSHVFGRRNFFSLASSGLSQSITLADRFLELAAAIGVKYSFLLAKTKLMLVLCVEECMTPKKRTEKLKNIHGMKPLGNCFDFALVRYSASCVHARAMAKILLKRLTQGAGAI